MIRVPRQLGKFGSRSAFEFFLETMHEPIIQGLRKYLSGIRAEDIPTMVRAGKFPAIEHLNLSAVGDNIEHIEKISLVRLVEFIAEARPDLVAAIQDMGEPGAEYLAKLRQHILGRVKSSEFKKEEDTVLAHCDECGKKWPVKKAEAASIRKCPFCGAGDEEEKKEAPSEEE